MRRPRLERKAVKFIMQQMEDCDKVDRDTVVEFIRPHYICDPERLIEKELKEIARNLIKNKRCAQGLSDRYHVPGDGKGLYVDITVTDDLAACDKAELGILKQYSVLNEVVKKFEHNKQRIQGQMSVDDIDDAL